jgi:GTP-binding protein
MLQFWEEMPNYFITSSSKKIGRDEVLQFIDDTNIEINNFKK